jgi:hypothetical protein
MHGKKIKVMIGKLSVVIWKSLKTNVNNWFINNRDIQLKKLSVIDYLFYSKN